MTPAQAIKAECRWCIGAAQTNCITKACKLHPAGEGRANPPALFFGGSSA